MLLHLSYFFSFFFFPVLEIEPRVLPILECLLLSYIPRLMFIFLFTVTIHIAILFPSYFFFLPTSSNHSPFLELQKKESNFCLKIISLFPQSCSCGRRWVFFSFFQRASAALKTCLWALLRLPTALRESFSPDWVCLFCLVGGCLAFHCLGLKTHRFLIFFFPWLVLGSTCGGAAYWPLW